MWAMVGAATPILVLIILLASRVRPLPAIAVAVGVLLAMGVWFPIDRGELGGMSERLATVALNVVFILLGGLVLSVLSADSGAQKTMSGWLARATHSRNRAVLLYGLGVTPFMDGMVGWGVSIIVVLPLLLGTGLSGTRAAAVTMLGHFVGPWGSLGPGLLVTAELGRVNIDDLGAAAGWYNIPVVVAAAVAIAWIGNGKQMMLGLWAETACAVVLFVSSTIVVSTYLTPALSGVIAPLAVIVMFLLVARIHGARVPMTAAEARTFGPFGVLLVSMLAVSVIAPFISHQGLVAVMTSPGLWLMVAACTAPAFFAIAGADLRASVVRGVKSWVPVTVMTLLYIVFGVLLTTNGMSGTLAAAAASTGPVFVLLLPYVSWIAGYLTASNTAASTMLTPGVAAAAGAVGMPPVDALGVLLAAGGSAGGAAPSRIALAVSIAQSDPSTSFNKVSLALLGVTLAGVTVLAVLLVALPF